MLHQGLPTLGRSWSKELFPLIDVPLSGRRSNRSVMVVFYIISALFVVSSSSSAFLAPLATSRKSRATAGGSPSVCIQSCHDRTTIMTLGAEDTGTTPDRAVGLTEIEVSAVQLIRMEMYSRLISSSKQLQQRLMVTN